MSRVSTIGDLLSKINLKGSVRWGEPLALHTTFRVGGPAEAMVFPASFDDVRAVRHLARQEGLPLFVLGRGANIIVADQGLPGLVLNLRPLNAWSHRNDLFTAQAGLDASRAAEAGRDGGFSCLEFLNGMPSTLGGAVYMNARCYGAEVSEVFDSALVLDEANQLRTVPYLASDWAYKVSPFQGRDWLILETRFRTRPAAAAAVAEVMRANAADREAKGHFRLPCAGSIFKNDHRFGAPSGVLIDRAGLKGRRRGAAAVSSWHGNIFVNEGGARARDLRALITEVKDLVEAHSGHRLDEEVLYVGAWDEAAS